MSGTILDKAVPKSSKELRRAKVEFNYSPQHDDELQLEVDDIIEILEEEEEGWLRGILRGVVGVFPSNFVTELPSSPKPSSKDNKSSVDSGFNTPTNQDTPSVHSSDDVLAKKKVPMPKKAPPPPPPSYQWSGDAPSIPPRPVREQAIVIYPYQALNEDELTLKEGDVITIISKEIEDVGWWKGEINGMVGVFPDNFVEMSSSQEIKKSPPKKDGKCYAVPFTAESQLKKPVESNTSVIQNVPSEDKPFRPPLPPHKKPPPSRKPERLSVGNIAVVLPSSISSSPSKENVEIDALVTTTEQLPHIARAKGPSRRPPTMTQRSVESNGLPEILPNTPIGIKVLPTNIVPVSLKPIPIKSPEKKSTPEKTRNSISPKPPVKLPEKEDMEPTSNAIQDIKLLTTPEPLQSSSPCPTLPCPPPPPFPDDDDDFEHITTVESATCMEIDEPTIKIDIATQHNSMQHVNMEDFIQLQDQVMTLKSEMEELKCNFKKQLFALMTEVDEEKKLRLELQVKLERIKTLMTTV